MLAPASRRRKPDNAVNGTSISEPPSDRSTGIVVVSLALAVLLLIGLVAALTLLPAQSLSNSIIEQARSQQIALAGSLSRQMETFFNTLANDLLSLTQRNDIQSTTRSTRQSALKLIGDVGSVRVGSLKSIVRLDQNGAPMYAWPDALNQKIASGQPFDWQIDASTMQRVVQTSGVQFIKRPTSSGLAYLMVVPIPIGTDETDGLAFEIDLRSYFAENLDSMKPETSQIWLFEPQGPLVIYQRHPTPTWTTSDTSIFTLRSVTAREGFPSGDRDAVIAPIYTAFTQNRSQSPSLVLVLSRVSTEGQAEVYDTLNKLFVGGVAVVLLIVALGLGIGRYVVNQANRRRQDAQRRASVRTLLEMSRALNSSLDLPVVLNKILDELAILLPNDSASVMLLDNDPDDPTVTIAAQRGLEQEASTKNVSLTKVRGTREVVRSGKPVIINDTHSDPRWNTAYGSAAIASWMGVPLRLRDQAVGVLNINSTQPDRFGPDEAELAEAFADQACVAIENARAHQMQIRQYESELETAHAIQTSLLPSAVPPMPQIEIAAQSLPARHVSGDYYQYLLLPDGRLGVAVGDVSGKGIPAALLMAVITTALREEVLHHSSPATLLTKLNADLLERMQVNHMNSALLVAIFNPATRHVEIANGGMVQPYIRTESGWEFVPVGGYPLGASGRSSYTAKTVLLAPGALLLFISDGVIEAQNGAGEFYGFDRLEALLNGLPFDLSSSALVDCILQAVHQHLGGLEAQDDVTVVVMKSVEV